MKKGIVGLAMEHVAEDDEEACWGGRRWCLLDDDNVNGTTQRRRIDLRERVIRSHDQAPSAHEESRHISMGVSLAPLLSFT